MSSAPRRVFGTEAADEQPPGGSPQRRRLSGRVSFSTIRPRTSIFGRRRSTIDEENGGDPTQTSERPAIPSALQPGESYATPLPVLSMIVLSIVCMPGQVSGMDGLMCFTGHAWRVSFCKRLGTFHTLHGPRCVPLVRLYRTPEIELHPQVSINSRTRLKSGTGRAYWV